MAEAKKIPIGHEIILTLNQDEARVLKDILQNIGGSPNSPCRYSDAIEEALDDAGVEDIKLLKPVHDDQIFYKDYDED